MRNSLFTFLTIASLLLTSCVDLEHSSLDKRAEVNSNWAIPMGRAHITLADILDVEDVSQISYIARDQQDSFLLYYSDTFRVEDKQFHPIDLNRYSLDREPFVLTMPDATLEIGESMVLEREANLSLSSINQEESDERLDSALIRSAKLQFVVRKNPGFDFEIENIEQISVTFDSNFRFLDGLGNTRYADLTGVDFGDTIDIELENFCVNVMRNRHPSSYQGYSNNTLDSLRSTLTYTLRAYDEPVVLTGGELIIDEHLRLHSYEAIWGFFQGGGDFRGTGSEAIEDLWSGWGHFSQCHLRLTHPQITIQATHHVAAPLQTIIDYVYVRDNVTGERRDATWNGSRQVVLPFTESQTLDPVTSDIHDSIEYRLGFNESEGAGRLDRLFDVRPDSISYSFRVLINDGSYYRQRYPQHRLSDDKYVQANVILEMPFRFNPEADVEYEGAIEDVDLSQLSIDSLVDDQDWLDTLHEANLKLVLAARNFLPFRTHAEFRFLDEDGEELPLYLTPDSLNSVDFPAPSPAAFGGQSGEEIRDDALIEPVVFFVSLDHEQTELITRVRRVEYTVRGSETPIPCRVSARNGLQIHIGVALRVHAVIDMGKF